MCRRCVTPYPTRPTRPLEHSHCRASPPRTVRVHYEHLLMWYQCTGRTRRSGRSVYTGNPPRTVRERYARRVKLSVCTRPMVCSILALDTLSHIFLPLHLPDCTFPCVVLWCNPLSSWCWFRSPNVYRSTSGLLLHSICSLLRAFSHVDVFAYQ